MFRRSLCAALLFVTASSAAADGRTCEVALHLDSAVVAGALQIDVFYAASGATPAGSPEGDCVGDAANALAIFSNHGDQQKLTASFLSLVGIPGPLPLAHCHFVEGDHAIAASDFDAVVVDASDLDGKALAGVHIGVSLPDCDPAATTTSTTTSTSTTTTTTTTSTTVTSTTTTTLPACGNGVVDGDEECDDGNDVGGDGCEADCTSLVLCGDASGNHELQTSDALLVLRAAVGLPVVCPLFRCDADGDAKLRTADSLRVLKRAVGQSVVMACPLPA